MSTLEAVRLYSVASAAALLEVSTDYVYDRIKATELAVVELGHGRAKQRIRADVLQAFIDSRTYGGANQRLAAPPGGRPGGSPAEVLTTQETNERPPGL